MGGLLERLSLEGREDQYGDLIAGLLFVRFKLFCQLRGVIHGEDAGEIHDAPGQRRDVQRSKRHGKEEQQPESDEDPCRRSTDTAHIICVDHAHMFSLI